jgi:hypothetical protein
MVAVAVSGDTGAIPLRAGLRYGRNRNKWMDDCQRGRESMGWALLLLRVQWPQHPQHSSAEFEENNDRL